MKKKLTDNDPRLTAYALGELPRDEADEIARMLDANENRLLKREVAEIDSLSVMLTQSLGAGAENADRLKLSPSQRDAVFRSAKAPTVDDVSSMHKSTWLRPVMVILGAAALVTVSFMVMDNVDSSEDEVVITTEENFPKSTENKLSSPIQPSGAGWERDSGMSSVSSGGMSEDVSSTEFILLEEHDWKKSADEAVVRMPMVCGNASWNLVRRSIVEDGVLPDQNAVRIEEILNVFHYDEPADLELSLLAAGVELVQCPWNKESMVAVILVKNKYSESIEIEAAVAFSDAVEKHRLVGYARAEKAEENRMAPAKVIMESGGSHIVLYEMEMLEAIEDASDVLSLSIRAATIGDEERVSDDKSLNVQYSRRSWLKADQDVQFALLLASWGQFLTDSVYDKNMSAEGVAEMITRLESSFSLSSEQTKAIAVLKKSLPVK